MCLMVNKFVWGKVSKKSSRPEFQTAVDKKYPNVLAVKLSIYLIRYMFHIKEQRIWAIH